MKIEDLTEEQKEFIRLLKHGTYSVERAVAGAFEESETLQEFSDSATNDLEEISSDAVAAIEEIHKLFEVLR